MARKIYKRIGLRRDRNFGDLADAKTSLNNLLNGLVEDQGRESFISEDLNAIRNVSNIGLKVNEYRQVIGSTINFTTSDGDNKEYTPHITFQNRLDQFKVFSGNPRIGGGNGLDARYWQKDQIEVNEETGPKFDLNIVGAAHAGKDDNGTNNSLSDIFTGTTSLGTIPPDQFWEQGNFDYSGKIHPQSVFTDGGVKWEGYFVPIRPGRHSFSIQTTAFCTIDFEQENYAEDANYNQTADSVTAVGAGNTFKSWWRVGLGTELNCSASGAGNVITIPAYKSRHVGIGMSVKDNSGNIKFGVDPNGNFIYPKIESFSNSASNSTVNVTLTPVSGETESVNGSFTTNGDGTPNVEFFRNYGDEISMSFTTHFLKEFEKYKVRFRYFFPKNIDSLGMTRRIEFNWRPPTTGTFGNLRYTKLFTPDYDFSDSVKGSFNKFFDTSVRFGGTDWTGIGPTSGTDDYIKISSSNKVQSKYNPPTSYTNIVKATNGFNITTGSDVLTINGGSTGGIEIGNYIFPTDAADTTSIPEGARVVDIQINNAIIIDKPCTATTALSCIFIDHRGFVKRMLTKGKALGAVDVHTTYKTKHSCSKWGKEIRPKMLVIQGSPQINAYSYVASVTSDTEFLMNDHSGSYLQTSAWVMTYFYQARGLVDLSLDYYCGKRNFNTYGSGVTNYPGDLDTTVATAAKCKLLVGATTAGVSQLTLKDRDNINAGDRIEGFGIPINTTIGTLSASEPFIATLVNSGNPVNTEENTSDGATVTVSSGSESKQLCCPPTDTSPPFAATLDGLQTTATNKYLFMNGGNIIFDNLKFRFPSNAFTDSTIANRKIFKYNRNTTDDSTISQEYCNRKISIKTSAASGHSSGNFTILCTTGN